MVENFGRNISFAPASIRAPHRIDELQELVRRSSKIRVMGSKHSWSHAIVTEDTLVSLEHMNHVLTIDRNALRMTAQAGTPLTDAIAALEAQGLTLANLGSIADQTLAGAISTGTHGTGRRFGCLAEQVEAIKLVDGHGELRILERGEADFDAAIIGLGCFGIIVEMTLSVVPCFRLHTISETLPFDEVIDRFDELVDGHDHFKFWWLVPDDRVIVFRQRRTNEPANENPLRRWLLDDLLSVQVYRACLALERLNRQRIAPVVNRVIGNMVGRRYERISKSHQGFLTPVPPIHRESEWAFDYGDAKALLRDYRTLMSSSPHQYSFIQEIRVTAADEYWMSPAYQRESLWLTQYNIDASSRWDDQLQRFESFARAHRARPHWGKEASFDRHYLEPLYSKYRDFFDLAAQYDPEGVFRSTWIEQLRR